MEIENDMRSNIKFILSDSYNAGEEYIVTIKEEFPLREIRTIFCYSPTENPQQFVIWRRDEETDIKRAIATASSREDASKQAYEYAQLYIKRQISDITSRMFSDETQIARKRQEQKQRDEKPGQEISAPSLHD